MDKNIVPWEPQGILGKKEFVKQNNTKKEELLFVDNLINMRDSPLPLVFQLPRNGKRFLNIKNCRALQSKISLKFPMGSVLKEKPKYIPTIKQSIIDEFEKTYKINCD